MMLMITPAHFLVVGIAMIIIALVALYVALYTRGWFFPAEHNLDYRVVRIDRELKR